MKAVYPVNENHDFHEGDFVGGHVALDFVNTVTGRNGTPCDWLPAPQAFAIWAKKAGILTAGETRRLIEQCKVDPDAAAASFDDALELREAMFLVLDAITRGSALPRNGLDQIECAWRKVSGTAELRWTREQGILAQVQASGLDAIASRVVSSFVELGPELASPRLHRCDGPNCAWFFFDTSKAGRRRWCDMAVCGNAAKYERTKDGRRVIRTLA